MSRLAALIALTVLPSSAFGQASTTVLWYHGNQGTQAETSAFTEHITQSLNGAVAFENDWSTLTLSDYRFAIIARPRVELDAGQLADLQNFLDNGGFVVFAGESAVAGVDQINAINTSLEGLGLTMRLENVQWTNDLDDMTNLPDCRVATVPNETPILGTQQAISVQEGGDLDIGSGIVIEAYNYQSEFFGTANYELIGLEGNVILTADYDFFTNNECGISTKEAFWTGIWLSVCDRDADLVDGIQCGGFDCDDTDDSVGADVAFNDLDGDGFGDDSSPAPCMPGAVTISGDCDDTNPDINPDAVEICEDGIDNDCAEGADVLPEGATEGPEWFADFDGDGFGDANDEPVISCDPPPNHIAVQGDCDDTNPNANEEAQEICNNNADDNCNGITDEGCVIGPPPQPPGEEPCGCQSQTQVGWAMMLGLGALLARRR